MSDAAASAAVAADVVALTVADVGPQDAGGRGQLQVLLTRRRHDPFAGEWSLPGVLVRPDEDLEAAARRALGERAAVVVAPAEPGSPAARSVRHLEQLATFGSPGRDPRGRIVSASYLALMPSPTPVSGDAVWRSAVDAPPLAFDHSEILSSAVDRLRGKLSYSNVAYGLLEDTFTLSELQEVYETVLDRDLDKRNFRKKVLSLGMLVEGPGQRRGPHRPAQLYSFARGDLVLLDDVIIT
ncbi:MAG TPA: NUDIX domain-containing protein [Egibacteraceae bacterium]|nr:NUDIX domain-containing protein [Egibacteraceae bacterium]